MHKFCPGLYYAAKENCCVKIPTAVKVIVGHVAIYYYHKSAWLRTYRQSREVCNTVSTDLISIKHYYFAAMLWSIILKNQVFKTFEKNTITAGNPMFIKQSH